jgi:hypothetical protein
MQTLVDPLRSDCRPTNSGYLQGVASHSKMRCLDVAVPGFDFEFGFDRNAAQ